MFSGIIEKKVKALEIKKNKNAYSVVFPVPHGWIIKEGDSINIDGICTTVAEISPGAFGIYWMPETVKQTAMSNLAEDHPFNLEQPLTLEALISGHLISGHIDTTALVTNISEEQESKTITFSIDPDFVKYIIYKGSIAVNGVSLTIVSVDDDSFSISLIPYTLSHTNLGTLQKGDTVNIEIDMIAKYVEKLIAQKK